MKKLLYGGLAGAVLFFGLSRIFYRVSFFFWCLAGVCVLAALWGGIRPLRKRWLERAFIGCLCAGLLAFGALECVIWAHAGGDPETDCDYLIILGCGLHGEVPSLALQSRLEVGLRYLEAHPDCLAILSGGMGPHETVTEALAMERWLAARGVDRSRLIREEESHNTIQNIQNSLRLMPAGAEAAIVSNEFHLYRAKTIGAHFGTQLHTLPAPTPTVQLTKLNSWLRESASIVLMHYRLLFQY